MDGPTANLNLLPQETSNEKRQASVPAFKEWAIVCGSIARGETSLIFRKGGIAEGAKGFQFKHSQFYLFPTYFHEQIDRTRLGREHDLAPRSDSVLISIFVDVEFATLLQDWTAIQALEPFHILRSSVLEERFHYDQPEGLHVAFLRAFQISPEWELPFHPSYRGCRSWINLPEPPSALRKDSVLTDEEHHRRRSLCLAQIRSHIK